MPNLVSAKGIVNVIKEATVASCMRLQITFHSRNVFELQVSKRLLEHFSARFAFHEIHHILTRQMEFKHAAPHLL